ncbi:exosome complex RNA-binding protein Csl4 [Methanosalsum natronophilum]|nr:exosome complex RNA-binding protein Csl4 [Methanosalsum natronophilum]MCS3923537.1 exosome complex component CSL4 [Methanosalsum natronophilum]
MSNKKDQKVAKESSTKRKGKKSTSKKQEESYPSNKDKIVMPGELLGIVEELEPREGTYTYSGDIYSSITGKVIVDKDKRTISIQPLTNTPYKLKSGDIVIGEIVNVRDSIAMVSISAVKGLDEREILNDSNFVIRISDIRDSYVQDLSREFSLGDVVKAKIIDINNMRLTTSGDSLGVMTSRCARCHEILSLEEDKLQCPSCSRIENRKMSKDYGTGVI